MRQKYYFHQLRTTELLDFLNRNKIQYKVSEESNVVPTFLTFTLWSNHSKTLAYLDELKEMGISPLIFNEYTELDRKNAEYLWLWPQKQQIEIVDSDDAFRYECEYRSVFGKKCYGHEVQIGRATVRKDPPEKGKSVFWTEDTGFSMLFADRKIKTEAEAAGITGLRCMDVILKSGKISERIVQLTTDHIIPAEAIEKGHGERVNRCPVCGKEKYDINSGEYCLHIDFAKIPQGCDFCKTDDIYGGNIPFPLYIISQRFYRVLKDVGLTSGVKLSPILKKE